MSNSNLSIPGLRIERLLGRGGMAEVYQAEQTSLGRKVAVKVMDPKDGDAEFAERFLHEAKLVAALNNPHVITIYDFGKLEDDRLYISMEYVSGGDLEQRMKKSAIKEEDAVKIIKDLSRALNYVHKQSIVHRDIKPANILFRADGSLVLTDFGIAKESKRQDVSMTQQGMTVGSPAYSSPEQAQGHELDGRTDIYSVGVVFLEMLMGKNPFRADTNMNTAINHIQMPIPMLMGSQAKYQPLLKQMLAKKPANRVISGQQVIDLFESLSAGDNKKPEEKPAASEVNQSSKRQLEKCTTESVDFVKGVLDAFYDEAVKLLDELYESSKSNEQQWQTMTVLRNLRKMKGSVQQSFLDQLETGFDNFSRGEYQQDESMGADISSSTLSLVQHEDLEKNIAASNLIKRVTERHQEELLPLHARLNNVIGMELPEEACPVGPNQLAQYFKSAIEPLELERKTNQLFYKILDKKLIQMMGDLYQSLNKMLIDAGVLPDLKFASMMKKKQPAQSSSSPADSGLGDYLDDAIERLDEETVLDGSSAATPTQPPTISQTQPLWKMPEPITPNPEGSPRDYMQQLFGAIRQMQYRATSAMPGDAIFSAMNDSGSQMAVPPGTNPEDWVPAGGPGGNVAAMSAGPVYQRNDVVSALHNLQGNVALATDPDKTGVMRAFKDIQPGNLQPCPVQSLDTVIDAIEEVSPDSDEEPKQLSEDDCGTIDFVGMIFDYMLKDESLPDSVKALLSYLHIPYIKVALLDQEMFAKPEHPARLLLDSMSEAGSLWLDKEGYGQFKVFDQIKNVVDQILADSDEGIELFERLLKDFTEFTDKVKRRIDQLEKLSAQKAEAEQNLQKVKAFVHTQIKERVKGGALPAPLVGMLLYPWFDYLTSVVLRYGEKSEEWSQGIQLIDTLLWSVQPKTTEHEVNRLKNVRNFLNTQIQKGFDTVGYDPDKGKELLEKLAELQDNAAKLEGAEEVKVSILDKEVIERIEQDTTSRERVVRAPNPDEMTAAEKEIVDKLKMIEFGTWFEFRKEENPDETQKLKVAWYNEENLSYLMVNAAGKQVSVMTALDLARQMIAKQAEIVAGSAKPFFERALESIYQDMATKTEMMPVVSVPA